MRQLITNRFRRILKSLQLHEVVLKIRRALLVATLRHGFVSEQIIVRVVPLMRLLLALPGNARILLLPRLLGGAIPLPQLFEPVFPLLAQVRMLLDFGLVEPVDDGVLTLRNMYALNLETQYEFKLGRGQASR